MAHQWYALRSKTRKEDIVWKQVNSRGIEVFFPRIRVHPVNPRSRKIKPYFPGYMFVRLDLAEMGQTSVPVDTAYGWPGEFWRRAGSGARSSGPGCLAACCRD